MNHLVNFFYPVALLGRATNPVETLFYRIASSPYNSQGSLNPMKNTFLLLLKENMFNLLYASLNNILPLLTVLNSSVSKKNAALVLSGDYLGSHRFLRHR